jgi:hypothetical protein
MTQIQNSKPMLHWHLSHAATLTSERGLGSYTEQPLQLFWSLDIEI